MPERLSIHEYGGVPQRLFLVAPFALLTDHMPHGDGLVAFGFIRELATRGHELHVAAQRVDLIEQLPENVRLHVLGESRAPAPLDRLTFMRRLRRLYRSLEAERPFDVAHQLNPVDVGLSLALAGARAPLVLGPYVPDWPGYPKPGGAAGPARRAARESGDRGRPAAARHHGAAFDPGGCFAAGRADPHP